MNKNEKFNSILNECLDRIFKGETVEQCLRDYPEESRGLEPLLRTSLVAKEVSKIHPRPEFKARARYEFQSSIHEVVNKDIRRRSFFHWRWRSGWAIAFITVIVMILAGGGTVAAASNSMPDSALYPVKLATEQIQLAVTPSDLGKAELNAKFAVRRTNEIEYMASKGNAKQIQTIAKRLNTNLENMTELTAQNSSFPGHPSQSIAPQSMPTTAPNAPSASINDNASGTENNATKRAGLGPDGQYSGDKSRLDSSKIEKMRNIINDNFNKRQARLEEALNSASPKVKPAINGAIYQSQVQYKKAIQNLENAAHEGN